MLLKMMLYQGEHHKKSNKRFESASTLASSLVVSLIHHQLHF